MNIFKLFIISLIIGLSTSVSALTAQVTVSGSITGANSCTMTIDGNGEYQAGVHKAADLADLGTDLATAKNFISSVSCAFPTAIAIKFTSSLGTDSINTHRFGVYKTTQNNIAAYISVSTGPAPPTAGGVASSYSAIGSTLSTTSSTTSLTNAGFIATIASIVGDTRNIYTVINPALNPVVAQTFTFPFNVKITSAAKSTGWPADISGGTLPLASTMTLELFTL